MDDIELARDNIPDSPCTAKGDDTIVTQLGIDSLTPSFNFAQVLSSSGPAQATLLSQDDFESRFLSPFHWPMWRKMRTLFGAFMAATLAAYAAGSYALASEPLQSQWGITDTEFNIGITTFVAGFGFAPMILAPISEAYGRYWVFVGSGVVFFLGTIGCAVTESYAGMIVSRLVVGSGASVFATLTGGVVSDIFYKQDRNTPMSLYALAIMVGTGLGPLVSGIAVDSLGWRWVFYLQLITIGITTTIIFLFFEETRSNVVLSRMCKALNELQTAASPPQPRLYFQPHTEVRKPDINIIWSSFAFPMRLLMTEPVVFWFSAWASFAWAILYMQFSSIGIVFRQVYGFSSTQVGAVYAAVILGAIMGALLSICQEPVTRKLWPQRMASPEGRLMFPGVLSILLPAGLFWFGWSPEAQSPWISPALAVGSCTMGIFSIYLAVFNYLADTYHIYASSAQAAQSMCRNLLAGIFPLFTSIMLQNLTYGGAGSLLGGIGLLLTAIPWLLSFYGQRIREKSVFAREMQQVS